MRTTNETSSGSARPSDPITTPDKFTSVSEAALYWLQFGFNVIPITPGSKHPNLKWDPWLDGLSPEKIRTYWAMRPDHELGFIVGDDLIVFDADSPESIAALEVIETCFCVTPRLVIQTKKGVHHYFRLAPGTVAKSDAHCTEKHPERIDVKAFRGMVILPPSAGKYVQHCAVQSASELSEVGQDFIDAIALHNGRTPPRQQASVPRKPVSPSSDSMSVLIAALDRIDANCGYNDWFVVSAIIFNATGGSDGGYALFDFWSSTGRKKYKGVHDTEKIWRRLNPDHPSPVRIGSLKKLVEANGHTWNEVLAAVEAFDILDTETVVITAKDRGGL